MGYALRDAGESDLDQFLELVTDRFLYDRRQLTALRSMWAELIASDDASAPVVSDANDPSHVLHFGVAAFVSDDRAERYHRCVQPKIAYALLEEWCAGARPFLSAEEIARANSGDGLNLVVIHHGYLEPADGESLKNLRFAANATELRARGWNLRSYTNEVFGRDLQCDGREMGEALGFRVGQYSAEQLREAGIPADKAPYVWMANRKDAIAGPVGLALGMLFCSYMSPRFGFNAVEQHLLRLALDGRTDVAIANLTNSSLGCTKKHFREIYDKVALADAHRGDAAFSPPAINGARGVEVRRHLLNYIREHPEELRPYSHEPVEM